LPLAAAATVTETLIWPSVYAYSDIYYQLEKRCGAANHDSISNAVALSVIELSGK
jgi:hypothetical protein